VARTFDGRTHHGVALNQSKFQVACSSPSEEMIAECKSKGIRLVDIDQQETVTVLGAPVGSRQGVKNTLAKIAKSWVPGFKRLTALPLKHYTYHLLRLSFQRKFNHFLTTLPPAVTAREYQIF
jgi:hypothetical protein